jgi:hypothetical protein
MELAVIISAVALAAAFIGWRVVSTVRVARGKAEGHACESCPAARH